jgi:predicted DNA binding CopG/RHH family protein
VRQDAFVETSGLGAERCLVVSVVPYDRRIACGRLQFSDAGVLDRFRKEARRRGVGYQSLINEVLARHVRKDVA